MKLRIVAILFVVASLAVPLGAFSEQPASQVPTPPLYERLGVLMPISVVVNDFIDALVPDVELNKNPAIAAAREKVPAPYLKYHVTALVCQSSGGPCHYQGRSMKDSHVHLNITEKEWERMKTVFKQILDKHKVPTQEQNELVAIVESTKADIVTGSAKKKAQ